MHRHRGAAPPHAPTAQTGGTPAPTCLSPWQGRRAAQRSGSASTAAPRLPRLRRRPPGRQSRLAPLPTQAPAGPPRSAARSTGPALSRERPAHGRRSRLRQCVGGWGRAGWRAAECMLLQPASSLTKLLSLASHCSAPRLFHTPHMPGVLCQNRSATNTEHSTQPSSKRSPRHPHQAWVVRVRGDARRGGDDEGQEEAHRELEQHRAQPHGS